MTVTFRKLTEPSDLQQIEEMEGLVWSPDSVIPYHMTLTIAKFGGLFLGAYNGDKMIGFLYSFPGYTNKEPHLCSHMLGFLPAYRKQGLGVQMKWLQREEAIEQGFSKITWTYDPLETVNGYLNIAKLGGVVHRYLPNCYGTLDDDFNRGLPTDRFLVEWFIDSERVDRHRAGQAEPPVTKEAPSVLSYEGKDGLPRPVDIRLDLQEPVLLLPVPAHFQEVKRADMGIAAAWREATRSLFENYFALGYTVTHLQRKQSVVSYVLEKESLSTILGGSGSR